MDDQKLYVFVINKSNERLKSNRAKTKSERTRRQSTTAASYVSIIYEGRRPRKSVFPRIGPSRIRAGALFYCATRLQAPAACDKVLALALRTFEDRRDPPSFCPPAFYHPSARQINLPLDRSARFKRSPRHLFQRKRKRERERERAVSNEITSSTTRPLFSQLFIQERRGRSLASTDLTRLRLNLRLVPLFFDLGRS